MLNLSTIVISAEIIHIDAFPNFIQQQHNNSLNTGQIKSTLFFFYFASLYDVGKYLTNITPFVKPLTMCSVGKIQAALSLTFQQLIHSFCNVCENT